MEWGIQTGDAPVTRVQAIFMCAINMLVQVHINCGCTSNQMFALGHVCNYGNTLVHTIAYINPVNWNSGNWIYNKNLDNFRNGVAEQLWHGQGLAWYHTIFKMLMCILRHTILESLESDFKRTLIDTKISMLGTYWTKKQWHTLIINTCRGLVFTMHSTQLTPFILDEVKSECEQDIKPCSFIANHESG